MKNRRRRKKKKQNRTRPGGTHFYLVTEALGKPRQDYWGFKASLGYLVSSCVYKDNKANKGQQDGSGGKSAFFQVWQCECDHQTPCDGKRKPTPKSSLPLTSTRRYTNSVLTHTSPSPRVWWELVHINAQFKWARTERRQVRPWWWRKKMSWAVQRGITLLHKGKRHQHAP